MDYSQSTTTYNAPGQGSALSIVFLLMPLAIVVFMFVSLWRVYAKAGKPGWTALVPIYNAYVMIEIAGRPGWWLVLYFIPVVNIVVSILVAIDLAKAFGRSELFGVVGLWLFGIVGFAILAFGDDQYIGPGGATPAQPSVSPQVPPAAPQV